MAIISKTPEVCIRWNDSWLKDFLGQGCCKRMFYVGFIILLLNNYLKRVLTKYKQKYLPSQATDALDHFEREHRVLHFRMHQGLRQLYKCEIFYLFLFIKFIKYNLLAERRPFVLSNKTMRCLQHSFLCSVEQKYYRIFDIFSRRRNNS